MSAASLHFYQSRVRGIAPLPAESGAPRTGQPRTGRTRGPQIATGISSPERGDAVRAARLGPPAHPPPPPSDRAGPAPVRSIRRTSGGQDTLSTGRGAPGPRLQTGRSGRGPKRAARTLRGAHRSGVPPRPTRRKPRRRRRPIRRQLRCFGAKRLIAPCGRLVRAAERQRLGAESGILASCG